MSAATDLNYTDIVQTTQCDMYDKKQIQDQTKKNTGPENAGLMTLR